MCALSDPLLLVWHLAGIYGPDCPEEEMEDQGGEEEMSRKEESVDLEKNA